MAAKKDGVTIKEKATRPRSGAAGGAALAEKLGDSHVNLLPRKQLLVVLFALSMGLFIAFADQTGVTVALNEIGKDLGAQSTINWAGTSSLLANTVCQVLFGRLSDIFGRKSVFLTSVGFLAVADLACGFAQTGVQFYIFRAFAGVGQGGISSLSMVIMSDIITLKQRGKYQGILGTSVGIGNAVGPFIMSGFISHNSWRDFYHLVAPVAALIGVAVYFLVPGHVKGPDHYELGKRDRLLNIDYLGIVTSAASLTLLLVALSGGGLSYAWDSAIVILMFAIGGALFGAFLLIEWKVPALPMIPLLLFKNPLLCLILGSNFFFGMVYYSLLFYLPYYFQIVKGKSEVESACFLLPIVLMQALMSTVSGCIISLSGHYLYVVLAGYSLWTLGCGLLLLWGKTTSDGVCIVILLIVGVGVGSTFQPTMVAAQAQANKADRAVVISTRNVLRSFGGATGIAIASTTVSNTLLKKIDEVAANPGEYGTFPASYLAHLKTQIFSKIDTADLGAAQQDVIRTIYMSSMKNYFYLLVPFIAVCLVSSLFIKDRGLQCLDETPKDETISTRTSRTDYSTDIESN